MVGKQSYGFNTFIANRIGEIHRNTEQCNWYWIEGKKNIADLVTRGCDISELNSTSQWQNGPEFLKLSESEWPIKHETNIDCLPEQRKLFVGSANTAVSQQGSLTSTINIEGFSKYRLLLYTTARIMKLYKRFKNGGDKFDCAISLDDVQAAEKVWIQEAQFQLHKEIENKKHQALNPKTEDQIIFDYFNLSNLGPRYRATVLSIGYLFLK